jgi:hypothetical protein
MLFLNKRKQGYKHETEFYSEIPDTCVKPGNLDTMTVKIRVLVYNHRIST